MEVKVLNSEERKIELEIDGETHTLFNPLIKILAKLDEVEIATYHIPHPSEERIIFRLIVKEGYKAKEVLKKAIEILKKEVEEIEV